MDSLITKFTQTYAEIAKIPNLISARITKKVKNGISPDNDAYVVQTLWSAQDFEKMEKNIFSRSFLVNVKTGETIDVGNICDVSSVCLLAFSPSGERRAMVRKDDSTSEKFYLEIWSESRKEKTFDLNDNKNFGKIILKDPFKCLEWSADEKFILFTAEAKQPKGVSFFKESPDVKESEAKGTEYAYKETWGEATGGVHHSVLCVLNVSSGSWKVKDVPDISVAQAKWGPNDDCIVFIGYDELPYRLGVWACDNRKSALYSMDFLTQEIECLTKGDKTCIVSHSFSPNFESLVYLESDAGGPHKNCSSLQRYVWNTKEQQMIIPKVNSLRDKYFETAASRTHCGIYSSGFAPRCWSKSGKYLFLSTINTSIHVIFQINIEDKLVDFVRITGPKPGYFSAMSVLDVFEDVVICRVANPYTEPNLVVGYINGQSGSFETIYLPKDIKPHSEIIPCLRYINPTAKNQKYQDLEFEILVMHPSGKKGKLPLIVKPHGGPHSCIAADFLYRSLPFVKLGYAVCHVNYRGSTGFGTNSIDSLLGNIGEQDVADVQQAVTFVRDEMKDFEVGDIYVWGGSHGGFLAAHLCGQYPDFYKAAVLLNPVIDISAMVNVSDIPDWALVECGIGDEFDTSTPITPEQLKILWEKSPIKYVEKVKTPTLILLGSEDLRVPASQGFKYHQLLKAKGVPTKVCYYKDNHQLLKTPHDGDIFVQAALWFHKYSSNEM